MKILFLSLMNGSHWGGSEEMWFRLAKWMSEHGHQVGVACYDWPEKKSKLDQLKTAGAEIFALPRGRNFFQRLKLKKALHHIPFGNYNLVFVNQGGYKEVVYPPVRSLHKRLNKYILSFHNYDAHEKMNASRIATLKQWMENASLNVGAASRIFAVIERNFEIRTEKQQVWPNPLSIEAPFSITPYPELHNGNYIFTVLAELDLARKAQDILINTVSTPKWKDRNWQLHLYGKGKDEKAIADLIRNNKMEEKILLKGFTDNVAHVLKNTHLLLQCTRIDAMPLSVVEAMALSRPCLVTDVGGMTQWITNGVNGFVCDHLSLEGLDLALDKCWQLRHQWEQAGKNAYETFARKYPMPYESNMVSKLEQVLNGDLPSIPDL